MVGSDDYGRDLTGVQNLRKKHKRIEAEISSHEPTIEVSGPIELYKRLMGGQEAYRGVGGPVELYKTLVGDHEAYRGGWSCRIIQRG